MNRWREYLIVGALTLGVVVLVTRIPLVIALAKPEVKETPPACLAGETALREALTRAPRPVRLEGETPISACINRASDSADLQSLSFAVLSRSGELSSAAAADPGGREAVQLGYLAGAIRRGQGTDQGVYQTMIRRFEQDLSLAPTRGAAFRRGERAGRGTG
jgi:hypothetical protein